MERNFENFFGKRNPFIIGYFFLQIRSFSFEIAYFQICAAMTFVASSYLLIIMPLLFKVLDKASNKQLRQQTHKKSFGTLYEGIT